MSVLDLFVGYCGGILTVVGVELAMRRPTRYEIAKARETLLEEKLPEAEETIGSFADVLYVVARNKRDARQYVEKFFRNYSTWVFVTDESDLLPLRGGMVLFVEGYEDRKDSVDLWTAAISGGNKVYQVPRITDS